MKIKISLLTLAFFFAPSLVFASTPVWGTINSDTVWTAESGPYLVDFSIVPEGITLTVEEGTVVKFTGQRSMLEVSGNLVVSGTELSPVVFTSINDDSVGGDTGTGANEWGNILIKNGGVATIDHAEIRHGGWTGWLSSAAPSNIWNNGGNLTLTNSKISNAWTGITHSAGNTALTENIFTENNTGISVSGTGRVHFDHNNFFNNTGNVAWFDLTNGVSLTHSDNTAWGGTPGLVLAGEAGADYVFEKDGAPYVIDHFTVP
ncbi:MAG: right-handed parallel beta-helix repeat-containing protein, partial [Candidatus Paceibacterota bacterium]